MKLNSLALLTASSLFLAACSNDQTSESETATTEVAAPTTSEVEATIDPALESIDQKLSYIVGINLAGQFKRDGVNFDLAAFQMAVEDIKSETGSRLSQEVVQETIATMQQQTQEKQKLMQKVQSEQNVLQGQAYLTENAKKDGVMVTESGLQYKEVTAGEGPMPTAEQTVVVHYKGTLTDGTVFDSSYERGEPAEFPVTGVIQGWVEALQLMNVGDKFELVIPSELAYGTRGSGQTIGPDSTLLFDVELIEIK
ncbi:MAG: FKBP-type peptidyl-prolyl cis-trans isomerase FklB [Paraglaciecola sp.]|jgi:FKBP-type peptidyl-prolyl cis-trans isomerase FklB|uniref:FKBP-type peptidyl-prolyl cis-trans isomerase n=1 Tax=uncultured Paraglaciecola sp. TaxID=1765024 RepID=UPI0025CD0B69|nr:FKBP-type peptidyl-prolyl cis-trans isomerase [uncultured Paraglaciecola sp.]